MTKETTDTRLSYSTRRVILALVLLGVPFIGIWFFPVLDAPSLRSVLSSLIQVLGVLLAATVVTYIFWANATRDHFAHYGTTVLEKVGEVATELGDQTRVRYTSAIGLVGARVERNLSDSYKPAGMSLWLPQRPGDKWRNFVAGFQELEMTVFRNAFRFVLTTLVVLVFLLTGFVFALGAIDRIVAEASWLEKLAVGAFSAYLSWFVVLMTVLLRPGAGIVLSVEKPNADGRFAWFIPEFL